MRIHFLEDRVHTDAIAPNVRLGPYLRVDRDDVRLFERLNSKAAEKHHRG
jgi:hypothetical protein